MELKGVLTSSVTFLKGQEIKRNYHLSQAIGESGVNHESVVDAKCMYERIDVYMCCVIYDNPTGWPNE